ncbi:hypothetical protein SVIOM342S_10192 [Streptomyces violaceorubidus]
MWQQYTDYWAHLLDGDLGLSFTFFPTPVSEVIGQSLPWTLARLLVPLQRPEAGAGGQAPVGCGWARLTSYTPATSRMARMRAGSRAASGSTTV